VTPRLALMIVAVLLVAIAALALARPFVARADTLKVGAVAPDISGQSVFDGRIEPFSLKDQLKTGAVVLYFFPAAFTSG